VELISYMYTATCADEGGTQGALFMCLKCHVLARTPYVWTTGLTCSISMQASYRSWNWAVNLPPQYVHEKSMKRRY